MPGSKLVVPHVLCVQAHSNEHGIGRHVAAGVMAVASAATLLLAPMDAQAVSGEADSMATVRYLMLGTAYSACRTESTDTIHQHTATA